MIPLSWLLLLCGFPVLEGLNVGQVSSEGSHMVVSLVDERVFIKPIVASRSPLLEDSRLDLGRASGVLDVCVCRLEVRVEA